MEKRFSLSIFNSFIIKYSKRMKQRLLYTLAILFVSIQTFAQNSTTYTYDNLNRLTKVTYSNGVMVSYSYDALGNRTSKKVTGNTETTYSVTTKVLPTGAGIVTGGGTYSSGTSIELNAIANSGYKFSRWSDGDTSNPRSLTVTKNITLTAQFVVDESQPDFEVTDISKLNNVIYIDPVEASAGSDVTLSVNMKNTVPMEGFSFDLYLPEGMEFQTDEDGFPETYLSTQRTTARKTNTFEAAIQSDGALRVFAASTNGSTINGNDGEVVTVKIHIGASVAKGLYPLTLRQSALSDSNARSYDTAEVVCSIQVGTTLTCDVNQDGNVDISDIVAVINTMAGDNQFRATADVNGDDSIDISDVVAIINYMAGGAAPTPTPTPTPTPKTDASTEAGYCPDTDHPHVIDMGTAGKWACCNVGADAPWEYGGLYAWGETEEKSSYSLSNYRYYDSSADTYNNLGGNIAGTNYDVAYVKWGVNWRMPDTDQLGNLISLCTCEWTTLNGINGRKFTASNGASVFLPATGLADDTGRILPGKRGSYQSSIEKDYWIDFMSISYTQSEDLWFNNTSLETATHMPEYGYAVRPVSK